MADTDDRSPGTQIGPSTSAGAPSIDVDYAPQPYRPLSLLALGAFGLAVLSAVVIAAGGWAPLFSQHRVAFSLLVMLAPAVAALVCLLMGVLQPMRILRAAGFTLAAVVTVLGLGGLLAYSGSDPWMLPPWFVVLPVAALLLAWAARSQILRSEDTLSGLALSNWALGVVVVFGLMYGAYYTATLMAVRAQASSFTEEWLKRLEKGDIAAAYALTLPAENRPAESPELRQTLELFFNLPAAGKGGLFSEFGRKDYVRLLQSGDVHITRTKLLTWNYDQGEYQARYEYHVTTGLGAFDMAVFVHGRESKEKSKGRQWYVDLDPKKTGLDPLLGAPVFTAKGETLSKQIVPGREFVTGWLDTWFRGRLNPDDEDEAYLLTLPAARRPEVKRLRPVLGAALGPVAATPGVRDVTEPGHKDFFAGKLVEVDPKNFITLKLVPREPLLAALTAAFRPGAERPNQAALNEAITFPLFQMTPDGMRLVYDAHFLFGPDRLGRDERPVEVDAQVVVECDNASFATKKPQFQLVQIRLVRARTLGGEPTLNRLPPGAPPPPG